MAGSLNRVELLGNVGQDPEIRSLNNGGKVASLSVATSESWTDKSSGEKREKTEWHRVVVFNEGLAGVIEKYVRKGSKIFVEGQLQTRKWQDQSGQDRYSTEVILTGFGGKLLLLDGKDASGDRGGHAPARGQGQERTATRPPAQDLEDEIPF